MRVLALVLAIAACGSGTARQPAPITAKAEPSTADQLYLESTRLDYGAPENRSPRDQLRGRAVLAYIKACESGDHRACWRAPMVAFGTEYRKMFDDRMLQQPTLAVANACLAGDDRSCDALVDIRGWLVVVAIDHTDDSVARQLCDRGLAAGCAAIGDAMGMLGTDPKAAPFYERACKLGDSMSCFQAGAAGQDPTPYHERERAAARAECQRGIARGCRLASEVDAQIRARTAEVLLAGCRAGMVGDCTGEGTPDEPRLRHEMLAIACPVNGEGCELLAELHAPDGKLPDPTAERDALEQACQHAKREICVALVEKYETHALAEPVPHRAENLRAYLCKRRRSEIPKDFCK